MKRGSGPTPLGIFPHPGDICIHFCNKKKTSRGHLHPFLPTKKHHGDICIHILPQKNNITRTSPSIFAKKITYQGHQFIINMISLFSSQTIFLNNLGKSNTKPYSYNCLSSSLLSMCPPLVEEGGGRSWTLGRRRRSKGPWGHLEDHSDQTHQLF